jgi:hypothetical protein
VSEAGDILVRASVWVALIGYLAGAIDACAPGLWGAVGSRRARLLWTAGLAVFLVHIVSAFHVFYDWNHAVALRETARQTAEMVGRETGVGLWVNYLFTAVWTLDAALWWAAPERHRDRRGWQVAAIHTFMFFIVFNGTVVFGKGPVRIFGLLVTLVLLASLAVRAVNHRGSRA